MTATLPTTADAALAVACPSCDALSGDGCQSPSGRAARPHAARRDAALAHALKMTSGAVGAVGSPAPGAIAVDGAGTAEVADTAPAAEPAPAGPTVEEQILRLLVLKVLAARVAEADADARADVTGRLDVGVSLPGYLTDEDRAAARAGARDRTLGKVGLSRPSERVEVTDVDALTAWCLEHAPDEVEHKPTIRAAFLARLTAAFKADGGWVDPETSELLVLPGVEMKLGKPTLQVRPSADAGDLVAQALADGLLTPDGIRALSAGGAA